MSSFFFAELASQQQADRELEQLKSEVGIGVEKKDLGEAPPSN